MGVNYQELASGKYYEELETGAVFRHSITRTVTETDNLLFSALTHNLAWLHLDEEYSKNTQFGDVDRVFSTGRDQGGLSLGADIVYRQIDRAFQQPARHAAPHHAQPDEPDLHFDFLSSMLFGAFFRRLRTSLSS